MSRPKLVPKWKKYSEHGIAVKRVRCIYVFHKGGARTPPLYIGIAKKFGGNGGRGSQGIRFLVETLLTHEGYSLYITGLKKDQWKNAQKYKKDLIASWKPRMNRKLKQHSDSVYTVCSHWRGWAVKKNKVGNPVAVCKLKREAEKKAIKIAAKSPPSKLRVLNANGVVQYARTFSSTTIVDSKPWIPINPGKEATNGSSIEGASAVTEQHSLELGGPPTDSPAPGQSQNST